MTKVKQKWQRMYFWTVFSLILIFHFFYLLIFFSPAIADLDASGYFTQARLLFTTGKTTFIPEIDVQYIGIHWLIGEGGRYFCRYPPGFSVLAGVLYTVLGFKLATLINSFFASLILTGLFLILKREYGWGFAAAGMILLAVNPLFNEQALLGYSHIAVMCFLTWGIYFLFRWKDYHNIWDVIIAGLLFGCIPAIRYPESLFAIGIGVFLLSEMGNKEGAWRHVLACCGAAFVPVVMLLVQNHLEFGAFWKTAYGLTNEQSGFGWDYFSDNFAMYIRDFQNRGVGLFFGFGLAGILTMSFSSKTYQKGLFYLLMILPSTLLYMAYYGKVGGTMRFLLPVFVCFIVSGIWFLKEFTKRFKKWQIFILMTFLILTQFIWGEFGISRMGTYLAHQRKKLSLITEALVQTTEEGDVVMSNPAILQQLDYVGKWKLVDIIKVFSNLNRYSKEDQKKKSRDRPSPIQPAKFEALIQKFEGQGDIERETVVADQIANWAGAGNIFFVGDPERLKMFSGAYFHANSFEIVKRIPLLEDDIPKTNISQDKAKKKATEKTSDEKGKASKKDISRRSRLKRPKGRGLFQFIDVREIVIAKWKHGKQSKRHDRVRKIVKKTLGR